MGGRDYPRSVGEMLSWFSTDADCLDYLAWLRWPAGFVCPSCEFDGAWQLGDGRFECEACGAHLGDRGHYLRPHPPPSTISV